eukprot:4663489-Amphidinium_carterae.1
MSKGKKVYVKVSLCYHPLQVNVKCVYVAVSRAGLLSSNTQLFAFELFLAACFIPMVSSQMCSTPLEDGCAWPLGAVALVIQARRGTREHRHQSKPTKVLLLKL